LRERLPGYMVPAAFVPLERLPLTPNGKVDRRALPPPDGTRPDVGAIFVVPRTLVEEVLVEMWSSILKVEHIGIYDNFFELGGHSLLATRLIARICTIFRIDVPLRNLFKEPTIAGLAHTMIANEPKAGQIEKVAQILKRIEKMSTADVQDVLGPVSATNENKR